MKKEIIIITHTNEHKNILKQCKKIKTLIEGYGGSKEV